MAETSVELSDEGEIAEPAPTVDDEAVVSGDVEEIPSETVVELGEDEEATDEALTPAAMPLETEESSPVFDFEGRDYVALSEILPVLPLQMEEVVDVLAVLDEDQETSPIIIEKVEQDYTIYVIERFAWMDIAVETEDGLKTITLIDGGTREEDLRLQTEEISVTTEEMVGDEKAPNEGGSEEQTVAVPAEGEEEQTETVPAEDEEEQTVALPTDGEEEQTETVPADGEEEQAGEGQSDEEASDEGTDAHADGEEEGDTSVDDEAVESAEDEEQTVESSAEDETDESAVEDETSESDTEGDDVADEVQEQQPQMVADGFHTVIDLSEVEVLPLSLREIVGKMEAEQSVIEQNAVEPAVTEETDAPQPEVIEEQIAEDAQFFDDQAADERPLDAQDADNQLEALSTENIESMNVEPAAEEVVVELGEEQAEDRHDDTVVAKAAVDETVIDETTVDYDSALLSLTPIMEGETVTDYSIDVIADFDSTDIIVDGKYTITLLNGVNPCPAQSFTASTEYMNVSVTADAGAFPAWTTMEVSDVVDDDTISGIADSVTGNFVEVERVHAVDICFRDADGREIEPKIPISVVMTVKEQIEEDRETVVVHLDNEGGASVVEAAPAGQEENADAAEPAEEIVPDPQTVVFTSDSFSVYAVVVTRKLETSVLASDGENYKIEVTYGPDAGIPDGAVLAVSEVTEDEEYRAQVEAGLAGNKMITLARFFDIKIMNGEEEVHPAEAVEVRVWLEQGGETAETPEEEIPTPEEEAYVEGIAVELGEDIPADTSPEAEQTAEEMESHVIAMGDPTACAAHFTDEEMAVVDATEGEEADVVFAAESFSVWGVVYTVDFYYGNYEWHMDGGSYVGLAELVDILDIAEDAKAFVDHVANVVFSAPELLSVSMVENDTTVGAIKDGLGLECEYSASLTQEAISEIDATVAPAGDWALISLKAFSSNETLNITLEDGSVYVIDVKDAYGGNYILRVSDKNVGYLSGTFTSSADGQDKKYNGSNVTGVTIPSGSSREYGTIAHPQGDYRFVWWLRDDAVKAETTKYDVAGDLFKPSQNAITRNTAFIAYYAPTANNNAAKLVCLNDCNLTGGWVSVDRGALRTIPDIEGYGLPNNPKYCYSTDDVVLKATPTSGYFFQGWYDGNDLVSTNPEYTVKLNSSDDDTLKAYKSRDLILRPVFAQPYTYSLKVNELYTGWFTIPNWPRNPAYSELEGSGLGSEALSGLNGGSSFRYSVIANLNTGYPYRFAYWLKDDGTVPVTNGNELCGFDDNNTGNILQPCNILDRSGITYVAFFAPDDAKLVTVHTPSNGTVTGGTEISGTDLRYAYTSQNVTFTAVPDSGYYFKGWICEGRCLTSDSTFAVNASTVSEDMIIEPLFAPTANPYYEFIMTPKEDGTAPGYFVCDNTGSAPQGKSYYYGPAAASGTHYKVGDYTKGVSDGSGYEFHYWVRDNGVQAAELTLSNGFRGLRPDRNEFDTTTSFVAFFAPAGAKIIRLNWPEDPNAGWVSVKNGSKLPRSVTSGTGATLHYFYNTDGDNGGGVTLIATPNTVDGYEFLGWFRDGKWLESRDAEYTINSTKNTYDLNLVPLFELDAAHRDFFYVYFDGSDGVTGEAYTSTDIAHGDHTMYSRYDSSRNLSGANFAYIKVGKGQSISLPSGVGSTTYSNVYSGEGTQTINLTRPQGTAYNGLDLYKWYKVPAVTDNDSFGSEANYLNLGATVTVDRDMVFYADWFPASYDFSDDVSLFQAHDQVTHKDTSGFINTYLYDYTPIFNMPSLKLNSDSAINRAGNYEYWYMPDEAGNTSRNFLFITALSDEVRLVSPRNRKQSLRNQNRETTTDGTFYSGITSTKILDTPGLKNALFDQFDGLGKRYVGEAKNLYLYDDATGYYYYDSDKNAAKYNGQDAFVLSDEAHIDVIDKSNGKDGDFLPFNKVKSGDYIEGSGEPNYWFGMQSVINFALPNDAGFQDAEGNYGNQSTHGTDMVFKFCGDDDVWVYVDDELFLDMGGIHGKVYGEINFSTGKTVIACNGAEKKNGAIMTYEGNDSQVFERDFPKAISEGENHTLKVYYLERGSSQSNCAIYFNISPSYRVQLHKRDKDTNQELRGVTFEVYHDPKFEHPANELWWKDLQSIKQYSFDTGDNGMVTISGMLAGHTYYIREAKALAGYPDLKDEVIKLTFDAQGQATFTCTPGFTGIQPTLARKAGSNYEFVMDLWNRSKTSVTVEKDWLKADGSNGTPTGDVSVGMNVRRYAMVGNPVSDRETHTVNLVAKLYRGQAGAAVYSDGDAVGAPVTVKTYSYKVNDGDSFSFDVYAHHIGDALAIYSVDSDVDISNTQLSDRLYSVDGTRKKLPVNEHCMKLNVTEDLTVNVAFIGDMGAGTEADFDAYARITEPFIVTDNTKWWGRVIDDSFIQTVTLPYNGAWSRTLENLEAANAEGYPYYYYVTEESITIDGVSKWVFYTDMYSPYAAGGDTIRVSNRNETVPVKLRKYDPTKTSTEEQRRLPGARFMIYTSYNSETGTGTVYQPPKDFESTHGNKDGDTIINSEFTTDENGNFYVGYLPVGRYFLLETKAPDGYNMLTAPVEIIASAGKVEYKLPEKAGYDESVPDSNGNINVFIPNTPGYALPSTGGPGTTFFYVFGSLLTLFAAALLLRRKHDY